MVLIFGANLRLSSAYKKRKTCNDRLFLYILRPFMAENFKNNTILHTSPQEDIQTPLILHNGAPTPAEVPWHIPPADRGGPWGWIGWGRRYHDGQTSTITCDQETGEEYTHYNADLGEGFS